ncbi:hypothetical protein AVEN_224523-1 [Araneus ventricosus]|uniref:Peptidase A2 domain-containing protein n=1 Tax=Araneus ventricosus TaxID=182803 RepID=A0A4Y2VS48_ARAVE|nr:hypothetical protein AVEN_224523-1 [Araneus ventricosus]
MSLTYAEFPQDVRDSLAGQHFVDTIIDEDTQQATRLMDAKDMKSALVYSMKYEAAKTVSKISRNVRSIDIEDGTEKEKDEQFGAKTAFSQKKAPEEGLKVSALCRGRNGLYLEGSICGFPCLMLEDTGANVTLIRTELAQKLKEKFICTAPNISLKTATGEKAEIYGKLDAAIECGSRKFQHRIYNEKRTGGEEILLFSASEEHSKLCSVLAKEKTVVPATSECLIKGVPNVSGQFRYAVTYFPCRVSQKGVLVAATLVELKRESIPIRVLNLDNKPKTVDKGAVIATCEPVVEIVALPQEFSESLHLPLILENLEGLNEDSEQQ